MTYQSALTDTQLRATPVPVSGTVAVTSTTITGSVAVTGPLTDAQIRATPLPVSGTVTTGGLTDAQLRASLVPVSLTSTTITGTVAATQSGAWNVTNVSGTVSLPTGASTSALQTTGNSSLSSIDGKVPALGQALAASSTPVVLTAAQVTTLTPPAAITGFSTEATLSALNAKVTAVNTGAVVLAAGAAAIGSVSVTGSVAVTGPLTDAQLRASVVPVSLTSTTITGTVAATQSGAWSLSANQSVNVAQINGVTALMGNGVTGTGSQRVTIASDNTAFAVNATLQAGTAGIGKLTANAGVTIGAVEIAAAQTLTAVTTVGTVTNLSQLGGAAIAMNTGVRSAGTQRVTIATDDVVPVSQSGAWSLSANQSVNNAQINGIAPLMGNGVTGTGSQRVTIASDNTAFSVNATPPTLTKGTQGATGYTTQDLKDAGRSSICMTAEFTFAQVAETLLTMTLSIDGAAISTFTSRTITSGKRMRIQSGTFEIETLGSGTAPQRAYLRLRVNTAGATTTSSPLQTVRSCVNNAAIVKSGAVVPLDIPDGLEFAGNGTTTFGFTLETPDWITVTATGRAKITITAYEY